MSSQQTEERFLTLETKSAYQEKLLLELHEVLLERGAEIESLKRRVDSLEKLVREAPGNNPAHERPPHY